MDARDEHQVMIGEVKVASGEGVLKAVLGSCVGIAFIQKEKGLCGLAHCLLPGAPQGKPSTGGKYVEQAIESLMKLMEISPWETRSVEVHLAGGGNMLEQLLRENIHHIGQKNVESAKARLKELGFRIRTIDVGGDEGRMIRVDCGSLGVSVSRISR